MLTADPTIAKDLQIACGRLEHAAAPASSEQIITALAPMVTLYGVADRQPAEWKAFWGFYVRALGDLPIEAIHAGVQDYIERAGSEFFPKPGPLKEICRVHAIPVLMALGRARAASKRLNAPKPSASEEAVALVQSITTRRV
jgi:hypothetical protein